MRETLLFLLIGAVAGVAAYIVMFRSVPRQRWGILGAVAIGILGGVVGGWLMEWLGLEAVNWVGSLTVALVGALLLLWLILRVLPKQSA